MRRLALGLSLGSERARLTALYSALLLLAGGGLIALVYFLLRQGIYGTIAGAVETAPLDDDPGSRRASPSPVASVPAERAEPPTEGLAVTRVANTVGSATLSDLLTVSLIALGVFAVVSILLAWWMSGRVLRPVSVITDTARQLNAENLHERIALTAPPGELKQLADTFDGMLDRIERLVGAQQRFAANAAHELRTPLALQRAAAEIGLAGEPDAERVAQIRTKLIEISDDSERMIEGLLLLAASEQGLERREEVSLDDLASTATLGAGPEAAEAGVELVLTAGEAKVEGDPVLLDRLVHNLVANAVRYNHRGGTVEIRTGGTELTVVNTGSVVDPEAVPLLFEPFRRAEARRHQLGEGVGLGLSIVSAIARAHGAEVGAEANDGGGLTVRVEFPRAP
ncbi:ATP-binding protein [Streptomyces boninensis]|uniref:ATP-binding protein n=1 Tax=Streptomyces boninensis TaxID=2039455 RepID=UPI003B22844E